MSLAFSSRWWTGFGRGDGTYSLVDHKTAFHGWNGRLRAADVNGDGRADLLRVVTLPGQPTRRGLVQTLVSQRGGGWLAREDQVPDRLIGDERYLMVHVTAGDADGDGNTDLLFPMLTQAHPATACSPAFDRPHTSFTRVFGAGDGTFRWPSELDRLRHVQRTRVHVRRPADVAGRARTGRRRRRPRGPVRPLQRRRTADRGG
nr:hypothetical protein GCM10020092_025760 [Actinoplanes digitatis]